MTGPDFTAPQLALIALSAASALVYGLSLRDAPPSALRTLAKTLPIGALAALAALMGGPWTIVAALALSALGDAFISRDGEAMFTAGLASFLLAHVAYVVAMVGVAGAYDAPRLVALALMAVYGAGMARWLWPHLGPLRLPVGAYIAVILAMGAAAAGAPAALWPLMAGAALFVLSDTVLAAETFVWADAPRRWTSGVVWWTYYPAQTLIAAGFLHPDFIA